MIQRIQSVYLTLTTLLSLLFLKGSFLRFINKTGSEILMNFTGAYQINSGGGADILWRQIPISIVVILILLLSLASLLTFKNRKLQIKLTSGLIFISVIFIALICYYSILVMNKYEAGIITGYKMFIPPVILLSGILALRGIRKDENLVKSYDRLR